LRGINFGRVLASGHIANEALRIHPRVQAADPVYPSSADGSKQQSIASARLCFCSPAEPRGAVSGECTGGLSGTPPHCQGEDKERQRKEVFLGGRGSRAGRWPPCIPSSPWGSRRGRLARCRRREPRAVLSCRLLPEPHGTHGARRRTWVESKYAATWSPVFGSARLGSRADSCSSFVVLANQRGLTDSESIRILDLRPRSDPPSPSVNLL